MRWNVSQLLKSPVGTERRYLIEDDGSEIDELATAVIGTVRMLRTDRAILVMASGGASVQCACSRCLDVYPQPVAFEFAEEFFPTVDINTGFRLPVSKDDVAFTIDEHHILDLTEAVRQYTLLDLPMKPLCAADCAGLCPTCGARLREGPCGCPARATDVRWNKLEDLRLKIGAS